MGCGAGRQPRKPKVRETLPMTNSLPGRNMNIGSAFKFRGQRYICTGYQYCETLTGRWVELSILESKCPDCGVAFRVLLTETRIKRRGVSHGINRRCENCHRPGVPVEPRRRRAPVAAGKPTARRNVRSSRLARQQLRTASEARQLRKSQGALPTTPPAQRAPATSAEAIAETYQIALGMLA
jgi:hypothetical protein